jgi:hypothetical protein
VGTSDAPVGEPCLKGAVLREMMIWYVSRYGRVEADRIFRSIPSPQSWRLSRAEPAFGIRASSWYPMSMIHPMLDEVSRGLPDEGRAFAREANAEVVPRVIRGLYKVLFDMAATPERYARQVPRLWQRLHTTGERSMVIRCSGSGGPVPRGPGGIFHGEAISLVERWPGHHPLLCWTVIYTMAFVFEAMGYKTWEVERLACVAHGAERCETRLTYRR